MSLNAEERIMIVLYHKMAKRVIVEEELISPPSSEFEIQFHVPTKTMKLFNISMKWKQKSTN